MTDTPQLVPPDQQSLPATADDRENARLIAQFAHHDVWWYRSNQWNAANWGLLLIAAVVGLARMFLRECELTWPSTWHFALLECILGVACCWYLVHLHAETIETRRLMRKASTLAGAEQLRLRIWQRTHEKTDHTRGAPLVVAMAAAIAVGAGASVAYLTKESWTGVIAGAACLLVALIRLGYVVWFKSPKADA
jgi:hypothetical protein